MTLSQIQSRQTQGYQAKTLQTQVPQNHQSQNGNPFQKYHALHQSALCIARELAHQEFLMIEILQKIDQEKVFRFLGFKSLYQYAVSGLKLSEHRAYNFILVARKASQIDRLQVALKNKEITLSKAKRISSVITIENAQVWLDRSKVLSQRLLERAVAKVNPRSQIIEGMRFISENTLELKAALSTDTELLIKRVQDLLSQSEKRAVNMDETLKTMAQTFLEKNDPVLKAERVMKRRLKSEKGRQTPAAISGLSSQRRVFSKRTSLPQMLKHEVALRDLGQCQSTEPDGTQCGSQRWVDLHHVVPISKGGLDTIENLVTLCKAHHQLEHLGT